MPLTDTAIKARQPEANPFKLSDGGGLYLLVQPNGAKYWRLKYRYIHKLGTDNPEKSTKEILQLKGVRDAIGKMSDGTFANHLSVARMSKK
jgi:hypothetical protein